MLATMFRLGGLAAAAALLSATPAAAINCDGPYQLNKGYAPIATPYCQDQYLAQVANTYGIRVSGAAIRASVGKKSEVCRVIGHDNRVRDICIGFRNDGRRGGGVWVP